MTPSAPRRLPSTPIVYLVTARERVAPQARTRDQALRALDAWLDEALDAGVDAIQLRERDLPAGPLAAVAARLVRRAAGMRTLVIVNDRCDVACAAGADGVHLPGSGLSAADARALSGAWLVGRSRHEGDGPMESGLDYVLFGTVSETRSKPGRAPAGLEALTACTRQTPRPVLAIGGITPALAARCVAAGAAGVAAIGVFLPAGQEPGALGPVAAVRALRAAMAAGSGDASGSGP